MASVLAKSFWTDDVCTAQLPTSSFCSPHSKIATGSGGGDRVQNWLVEWAPGTGSREGGIESI